MEPGEALARWVSPELRAQEARTKSLQAELNRLPAAPLDQSTERLGWHSSFAFRPESAAKSIAVDLGSAAEFDAVALVPVHVFSGADPGPGYGFPVRFRVEALDDASAGLPKLLADFTSADFPNPGDLPVVIETPGAKGRFVRITATKLFSSGGRGLFALGELMVLRGERNVAASRPVLASDNYENPPVWQPANATDSQSVLGPPLHVERTTGHGFHSEIARTEAAVKWVQLDLGAARPLDEIRLYAPRPNDFPPRSGFGFPVRFRVEASDAADCSASKVLFSSEDRDVPNPGENPVVIPADGATARFVRVTATRLWPRAHDYIFALAELEVFSEGHNIALSATISASDKLEVGTWSASRLNDGFTSQGRLVNLAEWLRGLSRRRELIHEIAVLERARPELVSAAWRRLGFGGIATAAVATFVVMAAVWKQRLRQRRDLARLRRQIAADLHDEIGSNLGSIALLARLGANGDSAEARGELGEIQRIAEETAESMRDIVRLITPGRHDAAGLVAQLREIANRMLPGLECQFEATAVSGPFPLECERHLVLFYKEALHNIRKHARAKNVAIACSQERGEFRLRLADDGCGFDERAIKPGHGLASLRQRARQLGGELLLDSAPGSGTCLELRFPLP
jgi:signal transduction histidine kinase